MSNLLSVGRNWTAESGPIQERELRITLVQDPPYISYHQLTDGSYRYEGFLYDIWKIIAQSLNLRYRIVPLLTGGFGRLDENGTWTGMVGELAYGRADVALTWLRYTKPRSAVIDYIDAIPIDKSEDTFYLSKNVDEAGLTGDMFNSLLKPLHTHVWLVLLGTLLVLSLVLRGSTHFIRADNNRVTDEMTWTTCLFSSFMSLVGQGWPSIPSSLSGRTVTIFTWLLCIIIYTSYTANLISHLTVVTVDRPINSLRDFARQSDWMLSMYPGHIVVSSWKESRNPYERELYQRVMSENVIPFDVTKESALRFLQPKVLSYADLNGLFFLIGDKACNLIPLYDGPVKGLDNYIVIRKGLDQLRRQLNEAMRKTNEAGIHQQLKGRWIKHKKGCVSQQDFEPVTLGNALALMMIMPLGSVASVIICVFERFYFKWSARTAISYR